MQNPPSQPWRDEYPSEPFAAQGQPSEPWLAPLDVPPYHRSVSPYHPTSGQLSDLSGSLLVPPPPITGGRRPPRNRRPLLIASIFGGIVVVLGLIFGLDFLLNNQGIFPGINPSPTPTILACPPTVTAAPSALHGANVPLVATYTPFPTHTPYPTYTPFPTHTPESGGSPLCP